MLKKFVIMTMLCSLLFAGCAPAIFIGGAAVGIGGYKYYKGDLIVVYQAPFNDTWDASVKALEKLDYEIYKRSRKLTSGKIVTTGKMNERVKLTVKYVSLEETEVSIRYGLMGDEVISNKVKDKIREIVFNTNGNTK